MENRNQEVTSFVATFENHYKAMLFRKGMGSVCTLRPVPRCLSSSCGTAAFFTLDFSSDFTAAVTSGFLLEEPQGFDALPQELKALVESVYEFKNGEYNEIYKN